MFTICDGCNQGAACRSTDDMKSWLCDGCLHDYEYMFHDDEGCPYCDGEGWMPDECDCMEGCVACVEPSGMPCHHCNPPKKQDPTLQQILKDALDKAKETP